MDFNFNYTIRKICVKFELIRNHHSKTKPMDTIFSPEKNKSQTKIQIWYCIWIWPYFINVIKKYICHIDNYRLIKNLLHLWQFIVFVCETRLYWKQILNFECCSEVLSCFPKLAIKFIMIVFSDTFCGLRRIDMA